MNNTLHTPTPWAIHTCNENGPFLDSFFLSTTAQTWDGNECEQIICRFPTGTGQFSDMGRENLANAHLISAAPDLLSALEEMMSVFQDHEQYDEESAEVVSIARAAIAKAKGEA